MNFNRKNAENAKMEQFQIFVFFAFSAVKQKYELDQKTSARH